MIKPLNKLISLLTLCSSKGRFSSLFLIEAKGGSLDCIAISYDYDYDYHYITVIIIMTFLFENKFLQGLHTMATSQKAIFLIIFGLFCTFKESDGK